MHIRGLNNRVRESYMCTNASTKVRASSVHLQHSLIHSLAHSLTQGGAAEAFRVRVNDSSQCRQPDSSRRKAECTAEQTHKAGPVMSNGCWAASLSRFRVRSLWQQDAAGSRGAAPSTGSSKHLATGKLLWMFTTEIKHQWAAAAWADGGSQSSQKI